MGDQERKAKEARIRRLQERLANADTARKMADVLKGVLDLLADEL
jgi:hypothetical protein